MADSTVGLKIPILQFLLIDIFLCLIKTTKV